jgi:hypothetical protein
MTAVTHFARVISEYLKLDVIWLCHNMIRAAMTAAFFDCDKSGHPSCGVPANGLQNGRRNA